MDAALHAMRSPGGWAAAGLVIGHGAAAMPAPEPARVSAAGAETETVEQPRSLVLLDPGVENSAALLDGLPRRAGVVELPPDSDPIGAITQALRLYPDVAELHVVSHGEPGALLLAGKRIDEAALAAREEELRAWFDNRANPPAIVLYGCSSAAGESGLALIETLSRLTGASVSASDDPTGNPALGGDWLFERSTGLAARAPLFGASARAEFEGLLATFTVSNTNDSGPDSLRQAVADANTTAGADEIVFDASLNGSTITLTGSALTINDDVSITGPGYAELTIDGDDNDRIFSVYESVVRIEGLTLTGGNVNVGNGGAINAYYGDLTVADSVISRNTAGSDGGGIFAARSALTIQNSQIKDNSAGSAGGGVFVDSYYGVGSLVVEDSTISGNVAGTGTIVLRGGISGSGGGIAILHEAYTAYSSFSISNSVITGNRASAGGGVAFASPFVGRYSDTARLLIEDSTISQNRARRTGGGVAVQAFGGGPDLTIRGSSITYNEILDDPQLTRGIGSDGAGGGLAFSAGYASGSLSVADTTIANNVTPGAGGGAFINFEYDAFDVEFTGSVITSNLAGFESGPILEANQRGGSVAAFGGGIALLQQNDAIRYGSGGLRISDTTIASNSVEGNGGGIGIVMGSVLFNVPIANEDTARAASERGVDLYYIGLEPVSIENTTISGNEARFGGGIDISATEDKGIDLINSTISGNSASIDGGGIAVYGAYTYVPPGYDLDPEVRPELEFVTIADNRSLLQIRGSSGTGGVSLTGYAAMSARNSIIGNNTGATVNDVSGAIDADFTLIEDSAGATLTGSDNITGTDPALGPLADNGGPTLTQRPDPGSPVIDAGDPGFVTPPDFDQRGEARVAGGAVDMGAVEVKPPNIAIAPDPLDLGSWKVGTTSAAAGITISNTGGPLEVTSIDAAAAPFAAAGGTCSAPPFVLEDGESCTITYSFTPTATGPASQTIAVDSNDSDGPADFTVSGTGVLGALSITPVPVDFGGVTVGSTSAPLSATLENTGDAVATISSVGAPTAPFGAAGGSCGTIPFDIAAGDSCTLDFTFSPVAVGAANDSLEVASDAQGSPDTIELAGTGIGSPTVSLSSEDFDFGVVALGVGESDLITLTNTGTGTLNIGQITDPGAPFALGFGTRGLNLCSTPPFDLAPAASCDIEVTFDPSAPGTYTATFDVESNAPSSPDTVTLRGSASAAPQAIPVLGGWAAGLMAALLGLLGLRGIASRRRSRA